MRGTTDRTIGKKGGRLPRMIPFLLFSLMVAAFSGWFPLTVQAATFTVNSTADAVDANPGDGVCATAGGVCTLRAAIMETNALPGADSVVLPAGTYLLTLTGAGEDNAATGDLDIRGDLTITGAGAATTIVDANTIDRVFHLIGPSATPITVNLNGITIQGGQAVLGSHGGGIYVSGANLSLSNSVIRNCSATLNGGGIYITQSTNASTFIIKTAFNTNSAAGNGGALFNDDGLVDLSYATVNGSSALNGGGFYQDVNGSTAIHASTFSSNQATGMGVLGGGGIFNNGFLDIETSTLSANSSGLHGGGLLNNTAGQLNARNVTFSANAANGAAGLGGGLYNLNEFANQTALTHVTLNLNTASSGGGIANAGDLTLLSTIVANSTGGNCAVSGIGVITSLDTNLETATNSCNLDQPGDLPNTNPLLGALADNGGPTLTHALQVGSPAIDAAQATALVSTDQRLYPRTGTFDIGAYESGAAGSADLSILKTASPNPVLIGSNLTYLITVVNNGPSQASNVVVTDTLPAGAALVSATPTQGTCNGTTTITCNLGTIESSPLTVLITLVVTPSAAGPVSNTAAVAATETDPDPTNNSSTAAVTANNPVPAITTLNPSTAQAGSGAFTLTVNGNNFVAGSVVRWNGSDRTTTPVSGTQVTAAILGTDIATAGSATVTVFNPLPGGGLSAGATFTITAANNPAPAITTLNPSTAQAGSGAFTLTVNGSNFVAGSVVRWNGSDRTTTPVSGTQVTAAILGTDIATAGTATVTVFNPLPGGGESAGVTFTITATNNPTPAITTLDPSTAKAGSGAFTLTVNGSNFVAGSVVRWNGVDRTTTLVSSSQVTAAITSAEIATPGVFPVTVFNPAPGGGSSNPVNFTVDQFFIIHLPLIMKN